MRDERGMCDLEVSMDASCEDGVEAGDIGRGNC